MKRAVRFQSVCVWLCAAAAAGCEAPGRPPLGVLVSPGGTYEVHLWGRGDRPLLFEHRVRAEVYKKGALHLPARLIYVAGMFTTPFDDRFGKPDWIDGNVLRFPAGDLAGRRPPDALRVRNVSSQPFRSIRIETAREMFMILDLPPRSETRLPMTPPKPRHPNWFDVLVDSGQAEPLMRGHGTVEAPPGPRPPALFTIAVSAEGIEVAATADAVGQPAGHVSGR
jgi:hypothetical protein